MSAAKAMPMQTPRDLFVHELSDIHDAEQIIVQMLEEGQSPVQNPQLEEGMRMHAEQSRQHAKRDEQQMLQKVEQLSRQMTQQMVSTAGASPRG